MAFKCHLPDGEVVDIGDLPFENWTAIALAASTAVEVVEWWKIFQAPALYPAGAVALAAACARYVGQDPPASGWLTAGNVLKIFQQVEDDLPGAFEDGIPKAEGDPETT